MILDSFSNELGGMTAEELREEIAKLMFGRSRKDPVCVACGSPKIGSDDFRDDLSRQEFRISRLCQECQDSVFEVDHD